MNKCCGKEKWVNRGSCYNFICGLWHWPNREGGLVLVFWEACTHANRSQGSFLRSPEVVCHQQGHFRQLSGLGVWFGGCRAEQCRLAREEGFRLHSLVLQGNSGELRMENRWAETSNPDARTAACFPSGEFAQKLWLALQSVPAPVLWSLQQRGCRSVFKPVRF